MHLLGRLSQELEYRYPNSTVFFMLIEKTGFPLDEIDINAMAQKSYWEFCKTLRRPSYEKITQLFETLYRHAPQSNVLKSICVELKQMKSEDFEFDALLRKAFEAGGDVLEEAPDTFKKEKASKVFRWIHLSDFHMGGNQNLVWPNIRQEFRNDLKLLKAKAGGPLNAVFFTGDHVFSGLKTEFENLSKELPKLFDNYEKLIFLSVPGNHDLVRPDEDEAHSLTLQRWFEHPGVWNAFWKDPSSGYRSLVYKAFENYEQYINTSTAHQLNGLKKGIIPGDFAATLTAGGFKIGVVGLNTSFLHLAKGDFQGKLALRIEQLAAVCGEDYPEWCQMHDICFLLTHHPTDWLHPAVQSHMQTEIAPANRFFLHLYGHMHQNVMRGVARGGGRMRTQIQAASLFGCNEYGENQKKSPRTHGYVMGELSESGGQRTWRIWPRIARCQENVGWKFIPDHENYELTEEGCTSTQME